MDLKCFSSTENLTVDSFHKINAYLVQKPSFTYSFFFLDVLVAKRNFLKRVRLHANEFEFVSVLKYLVCERRDTFSNVHLV